MSKEKKKENLGGGKDKRNCNKKNLSSPVHHPLYIFCTTEIFAHHSIKSSTTLVHRELSVHN